MVDGKSYAQAIELTTEKVIAFFGGFPTEKLHYIELSLAALQTALTGRTELAKLVSAKLQNLETPFDLKPKASFYWPEVPPDLSPPLAAVATLLREALLSSDVPTVARLTDRVLRKALEGELDWVVFGLELHPGHPILESKVRVRQTPSGVEIKGIYLRRDALYIPSGPFLHGSEVGHNDEHPMHKCDVPGFWIRRAPVEASLASQLLQDLPPQPWSDPRLPAVHLNHPMATKLARSLGGELPSEAEWEKAARGGFHLDSESCIINPNPRRLYPWGDAPPDARCAFPCFGARSPSRVDEYPELASPYGVVHMLGGVWEWCRDGWLSDRYTSETCEGQPRGGSLYCLRGGAWNDVGTDVVNLCGRYYDDWFAAHETNGCRPIYRKSLVETIGSPSSREYKG